MNTFSADVLYIKFIQTHEMRIHTNISTQYGYQIDQLTSQNKLKVFSFCIATYKLCKKVTLLEYGEKVKM